jgi:hypothetical protein
MHSGMLKETDIWDTQKMLRTFWVSKEEKTQINVQYCSGKFKDSDTLECFKPRLGHQVLVVKK